MSDFDDLRGLLDDDDDDLDDYSDISFDDIVDDDDEFAYGQEIGATDQFAPVAPAEPGPINKFLSALKPQQRLIVAAMIFGNVLVLSIGVLLATGRLG
ncbi:MAG: hypothetical protein AAF846_06240 [Chloroflexota bacterium]